MIDRVIKWTGSKRTLADDIISRMPKDIDTYYEPFLGGGSVMIAVMDRCMRGEMHVNRFVCSDMNRDLISFFNMLKDDPQKIIDDYTSRHLHMMSLEYESDRQDYYNNTRELYNRSDKDDQSRCLMLFFLTRTCYNGLIRYNATGEFNTSFHLNRHGMSHTRISKIIHRWSDILNKFDVTFINADYKDVISDTSANDFIYMDPPYADTDNVYFSGFDRNEMFDVIRGIKCKYILSYNGKSDAGDKTIDVPSDIYEHHMYIDARQSSFRKLANCGTIQSFESLYMNY